MAKKEKPSVDKIVKRVTKEFEKRSDRVENIVSDAMKRFNEEMDRRLKELHELQESLMERFGVASSKKGSDKNAKAATRSGTATATATKSPEPTAKTAAKSAPKAKSATRKPAAKKAATKSTAAKASSAKATGKSAKSAPLDKSDLKKVKGIGPATEKKMKEAGITSIDQIANPSAEEQEKLKAFAKVRGSDSWSAEAKKLL